MASVRRGNVILTNIKDVKSSLRSGIRLNKGDIVLVEHDMQICDDERVKNILLMLVSERTADDNKNKTYMELIELGGFNIFKFDRALFTNEKRIYDEYNTLDIIGKCDIEMKIDKIHTYERYR